MNAPTTRRSHQSCRRISSTHASDVFQSSTTSWSSKIIADGTVDSSQRIGGSVHASRYSRVYSSKSAIDSPAPTLGSRRERMNSSVSGDTSSAYTWSPSRRTVCGHSAGSEAAIRSAIARSASTSRP